VRKRGRWLSAQTMLSTTSDCRARPGLLPTVAFFGNSTESNYARATLGGLREDDGGGSLVRGATAVWVAIQEYLADGC
jgi:hypothetical protein